MFELKRKRWPGIFFLRELGACVYKYTDNNNNNNGHRKKNVFGVVRWTPETAGNPMRIVDSFSMLSIGYLSI